MQKKYILALDSGTVKNRSVIFNRRGEMISYAEKKISTFTPHAEWIEQDAEEIWSTQLWTAREAMRLAAIDSREIAAVAVTNQRETTVIWNRQTGRPLYPAISWQSRYSVSSPRSSSASLSASSWTGRSDTVLIYTKRAVISRNSLVTSRFSSLSFFI